MNEESDLYCFAVGSLPCLDQNWYVNFLRSRSKCRGVEVGILSLVFTSETTACDGVFQVIQRASQGGEVLETNLFTISNPLNFHPAILPSNLVQFTFPRRLCWRVFNIWRMRTGPINIGFLVRR